MNKKGNIGIGILAMPYAFKNAGLWLGLFATLAIGILQNGERTDERTKERLRLQKGFHSRFPGATAVHCMHLLVSASTLLCKKLGKETLDYGYCIDYAFKVGPEPLRRYGRLMRKLVNLFLNFTQFGFCCVYFVFMASNLKVVVDYHALGVVVNDPR